MVHEIVIRAVNSKLLLRRVNALDTCTLWIASCHTVFWCTDGTGRQLLSVPFDKDSLINLPPQFSRLGHPGSCLSLSVCMCSMLLCVFVVLLSVPLYVLQWWFFLIFVYSQDACSSMSLPTYIMYNQVDYLSELPLCDCCTRELNILRIFPLEWCSVLWCIGRQSLCVHVFTMMHVCNQVDYLSEASILDAEPTRHMHFHLECHTVQSGAMTDMSGWKVLNSIHSDS